MSDSGNAILGSLIGRSILFGLLLGVGVYVAGMVLDLWQVGRGNYVILMVLIGSMVLLPAYEKLARLKRT